MIYKYDDAIVEDLKASFRDETVVKVIAPEEVIGLAAQIQNDEISLPVVSLTRNPEQIDTARQNFTATKVGIAAAFDNKNNELYLEKSIPVKLSYNLTVLTANIAQQDELVKELLFKYSQMYFLSIKLPYESDRRIRFGIEVESGTDIDYRSAGLEYLGKGQLYQAIIPLRCEGCVLLSYTPRKLVRFENDVEIITE